jgi:hypothetical protein
MTRVMLPAAALLLLAACSPSLDWRELRPEDSGAVAMFPCRPASHAREVMLAGSRVTLTLHACSAGDTTWALAFAELGDPARIGPAPEELLAAAVANLSAGAARPLALKVDGATPHPHAQRVAFEGRLPDGRAMQEQVAVFTKGTRIFQATALGPRLPEEGMEVFFGGLRTP